MPPLAVQKTPPLGNLLHDSLAQLPDVRAVLGTSAQKPEHLKKLADALRQQSESLSELVLVGAEPHPGSRYSRDGVIADMKRSVKANALKGKIRDPGSEVALTIVGKGLPQLMYFDSCEQYNGHVNRAMQRWPHIDHMTLNLVDIADQGSLFETSFCRTPEFVRLKSLSLVLPDDAVLENTDVRRQVARLIRAILVNNPYMVNIARLHITGPNGSTRGADEVLRDAISGCSSAVTAPITDLWVGLSGLHGPIDGVFEALSKLERLTVQGLRGRPLGEDGSPAINAADVVLQSAKKSTMLGRVSKLWLVECDVETDTMRGYLSGTSRLRSFGLVRNKHSVDLPGLDSLGLSQLRELKLTETRVTGLSKLADTKIFRQLTNLDFSNGLFASYTYWYDHDSYDYEAEKKLREATNKDVIDFFEKCSAMTRDSINLKELNASNSCDKMGVALDFLAKCEAMSSLTFLAFDGISEKAYFSLVEIFHRGKFSSLMVVSARAMYSPDPEYFPRIFIEEAKRQKLEWGRFNHQVVTFGEPKYDPWPWSQHENVFAPSDKWFAGEED